MFFFLAMRVSRVLHCEARRVGGTGKSNFFRLHSPHWGRLEFCLESLTNLSRALVGANLAPCNASLSTMDFRTLQFHSLSVARRNLHRLTDATATSSPDVDGRMVIVSELVRRSSKEEDFQTCPKVSPRAVPNSAPPLSSNRAEHDTLNGRWGPSLS
ncbi:hypothetical protein BJ322DRAFT_1051074 [Thelephora terrestris]|uniref:Uncharacterized protein n=1 Tax=Thelephora terrestris TaxID=56493 RepID=A0A9P6HKD1_9AGAM|nr:hypothetical protein BJ322DRAFT_1051074 [Thelephora terrestris]